MQLNKIFKASGQIRCHDDMSDKKLEEFFIKIEDVMNEYKVYRIRDVMLNPFSEGLRVKDTSKSKQK